MALANPPSPLLSIPNELIHLIFTTLPDPHTYLHLSHTNQHLRKIARTIPTQHNFAERWLATNCTNASLADYEELRVIDFILRFTRLHCTARTCRPDNEWERHFSSMYQIHHGIPNRTYWRGSLFEWSDFPSRLFCQYPTEKNNKKGTTWLKAYLEMVVAQEREKGEARAWKIEDVRLGVEDVVFASKMCVAYKRERQEEEAQGELTEEEELNAEHLFDMWKHQRDTEEGQGKCACTRADLLYMEKNARRECPYCAESIRVCHFCCHWYLDPVQS
ncbi:hypothetical protein BJ508DRAFT_379750 [Ascobolus immersus RN42]|uniref:F-box domain-containing protein n=1 Tax=Ascobolus immersus RN42 TaxID=1160509 RepID=A0A3N4HTV6_ASCIM|nr:hypothetical protein BJ508DRAFT_379750 [Ascobolus immersus RN42]